MTAAELEEDTIDYHARAWSKVEIEVDDSALLVAALGGPLVRMRGLPDRGRMLRSIEWNAWREGRDWVEVRAKKPRVRENWKKRLARKQSKPLTSGAGGSILW